MSLERFTNLDASVWIILGGLVLLGLICLWAAMRAARRRRLVSDLPTSKTTGVFVGLVELKGTAESSQPLTSYLAAASCVHYSYCVQEHWSRTVTETYTDKDGRTQTRTRHESGWTTVAQGGEQIPFYLQDDCGVILVRPEGAEIGGALTVFNETCGPGNPLYYGKGPSGCVSDSDYQRHFTEHAIPVKTLLYIMGQARERQDVVAPEIAADPAAPMFLITTRTEEQVNRGLAWAARGWFLLGLLAWGGGAAYAHQAVFGSEIAPAWMALPPALYILLGMLSWVWMAFNSLIGLRQRVRQGWSQVEVQLKRRFDLIPALVKVVTGLRDYERNLQTELAGLRAQLAATPPGVAGPDFQACGGLVVAVAERYPELKSQESFARLQRDLVDTEQRIALARGYFNEIATYYNTRLEQIPDRFIAALGGLQPQVLMAANDFERAPVQVDAM